MDENHRELVEQFVGRRTSCGRATVGGFQQSIVELVKNHWKLVVFQNLENCNLELDRHAGSHGLVLPWKAVAPMVRMNR